MKISLTKVFSQIKWRWDYGENFESILAFHEEMKDTPDWKTPNAILEMPELGIWEIAYLNDFDILGSERPVGMGLGLIPVSKIRQYAVDNNEPDVAMFIDIMTKIDVMYLTEHNKRQETK